MSKLNCIYNKFFFEKLYKYMIDNNCDTTLDASNTVWHMLDVEDILIKEYGYRKISGGKLL